MNFFGHAVLGREHGDDPRFLLGAMFPDFCSMAGLRHLSVDDPVLARGVDFHHASDDAFHGARHFVELMHDAQEELEAAGLPYGPSLAVGHVGVELLLDGWLATREQARGGAALEDFRQALRCEAGRIEWRGGPDQGERMRALRVRLEASPLPLAYADPAFVADRMAFILARRPRLALDPAGVALVARWAPGAALRVAERAEALLAELRARLEERWPPTAADAPRRPRPAPANLK